MEDHFGLVISEADLEGIEAFTDRTVSWWTGLPPP